MLGLAAVQPFIVQGEETFTKRALAQPNRFSCNGKYLDIQQSLDTLGITSGDLIEDLYEGRG
jgi:hypothetical protein